MKRFTFLVALLAALAVPVVVTLPALATAASKKAPAKKGPVNPLPEDGVFQGLPWGTSLKDVQAVLKKDNIAYVPVPTGRNEYVQIAETSPRSIYGMASKAVLYSFYDGGLVAVTVGIENAAVITPLHDLMASLKSIYGAGSVAAMNEEEHSIVLVFDSKTGAVVLFAAAPKDEVFSQVLFISEAEKERAQKHEDKPSEKGTTPKLGEIIKL